MRNPLVAESGLLRITEVYVPGMALSGVAAGVPYLAVPPADGGAGPVVVAWHLLGTPGTPAELAEALPMDGLAAWRVYLELPGTGSRPQGERADLFLDGYVPIVEGAVAELPAVLDKLRAELPISAGPVAVVGGSAGGQVALLTLLRGEVEVAAGVVVNPAVRAESVIAVNERLLEDFTHTWSPASRAAAAKLDCVRESDVPVLVVTGEDEYPEFRPDQAVLHAALRNSEHRVLPDLAHMFGPGTPEAVAVNRAATAWLRRHFTGPDG